MECFDKTDGSLKITNLRFNLEKAFSDLILLLPYGLIGIVNELLIIFFFFEPSYTLFVDEKITNGILNFLTTFINCLSIFKFIFFIS